MGAAGAADGGKDDDSGTLLAAAALDAAISYGLVYVLALCKDGEACCGPRDGGREPARDGSLDIGGGVLTAVKPPALTAEKPLAPTAGGALGCRDVPFTSLLEIGLSWILARSDPLTGGADK
jgi:hypothetical protein